MFELVLYKIIALGLAGSLGLTLVVENVLRLIREQWGTKC